MVIRSWKSMQVIIGDTRDLQDLGKNIIRIYILPRGVMVARLLNHPSHKIHILVMVVSLLRTKLIRVHSRFWVEELEWRRKWSLERIVKNCSGRKESGNYPRVQNMGELYGRAMMNVMPYLEVARTIIYYWPNVVVQIHVDHVVGNQNHVHQHHTNWRQIISVQQGGGGGGVVIIMHAVMKKIKKQLILVVQSTNASCSQRKWLHCRSTHKSFMWPRKSLVELHPFSGVHQHKDTQLLKFAAVPGHNMMLFAMVWMLQVFLIIIIWHLQMLCWRVQLMMTPEGDQELLDPSNQLRFFQGSISGKGARAIVLYLTRLPSHPFTAQQQ
jgi:hypothetical protein